MSELDLRVFTGYKGSAVLEKSLAGRFLSIQEPFSLILRRVAVVRGRDNLNHLEKGLRTVL